MSISTSNGTRVDAQRRLLRVSLLRRDSMGSSYHVLTFDAGDEIVAHPGQFAMVRGAAWGDAPLLPRPMSLLETGRRPSILIKIVGEGTQRMALASTGEPFDLLLPLGNRWSPCPPGVTPVLVAGGVGVAPLLFFARELASGGVRPITLYGGRSAADLPLHEELAQASDVRLLTEDGSRGTAGRVTALLTPTLRELGGRAKVYTCGPDRMMAAVAGICDSLGVPCEASLETPMACGYGVCLGCPVRKTSGGYLYACTEGPCVDAKMIAWDEPVRP
jgi:dihydroorotate dehydrogenase electron transfer subunit